MKFFDLRAKMKLTQQIFPTGVALHWKHKTLLDSYCETWYQSTWSFGKNVPFLALFLEKTKQQ